MIDINLIDLKHYELLNLIGFGSYSKVYKVRKKSTGNIFAAKISLKTYNENSVKNSSIAKEFNIISQFNHPSILKCYGLSFKNFQNDSNPVIITEFLLNGSLKDVLSSSMQLKIDSYWNNTKKLINVYGIASAMSFLHSNNIIHRDLKPSNVLVDDFLFPKISDFGLSKINVQPLNSLPEKLIGTPLYLAPEIWEKYEYSKAGDVYAFAIILYEIILNERPFNFCEPSEIAAKVTSGIRPAFPNPPPPAYKSLIERCWSHDPSKRDSFDQILIELRENAEFIDDSVDKEDFFTYVEYVESRQSIPFEKFNTKESKTFSKVRIQSIQIDDSKSSPKNGYQSIEVLKKSEDVDDIYRCGLLLMTGREVPVDLKLACHFFKEAADRGKAEAMNSYAWMLENGYGHCINLEQASKYYEKAADLGQRDAMYHFGWMLFSGKGVPADKGKSSMYFKMAANKGRPDSMYNFALMCQNGIGVSVDFCEAYRYYKMAADRGQIEAMNNLGIMLEKGTGITVDKREAVKYYRMATDRGQPNAMYNLGWMLWSGAGVAADREEAARYFRMAARKGHVESMFNLASVMLDSGRADEARRFFRMAAEKGHLDAMYNYALMVERDGCREESLRYYKMAAGGGHKKADEACNRLAQSGMCLIQ